MQAQGGYERDRGDPSADAWWAALVGDLLHPVQVQVIEALRSTGGQLTVRDLAEIIEEVEPVHLDYHVGRLRTLGVLDYARMRRGQGFMDVGYELVRRRDRRPYR